jgi:hypothetical protein
MVCARRVCVVLCGCVCARARGRLCVVVCARACVCVRVCGCAPGVRWACAAARARTTERVRRARRCGRDSRDAPPPGEPLSCICSLLFFSQNKTMRPFFPFAAPSGRANKRAAYQQRMLNTRHSAARSLCFGARCINSTQAANTQRHRVLLQRRRQWVAEQRALASSAGQQVAKR